MNVFSEFAKIKFSGEEDVNIDIDVNEHSSNPTQTKQWENVFEPLDLTPTADEIEATSNELASLEAIAYTLASYESDYLDKNHILLMNHVIPSMEGLGSFIGGVAKNVAMKEVASMVGQGVKILIQKIIEYIVKAAKAIKAFFVDLPSKIRRLKARVKAFFEKEEKIPEEGVPLPDNIVQMKKKPVKRTGIQLNLEATAGYSFSSIKTVKDVGDWYTAMQQMVSNIKKDLPDNKKFTSHLETMIMGTSSDSNPYMVIQNSGLSGVFNKPFNSKRIQFKLVEGKVEIDDPSHDFFSKSGMAGKMSVTSKDELIGFLDNLEKSPTNNTDYSDVLESYSTSLKKLEDIMKNVSNKNAFTTALNILFSFIKAAEWPVKGMTSILSALNNSLS